MDLSIEDFKQLAFELYLAQRENAHLKAMLSQLQPQANGHSHPHEHDLPMEEPEYDDAQH
jgi:hypothetical protein